MNHTTQLLALQFVKSEYSEASSNPTSVEIINILKLSSTFLRRGNLLLSTISTTGVCCDNIDFET